MSLCESFVFKVLSLCESFVFKSLSLCESFVFVCKLCLCVKALSLCESSDLITSVSLCIFMPYLRPFLKFGPCSYTFFLRFISK